MMTKYATEHETPHKTTAVSNNREFKESNDKMHSEKSEEELDYSCLKTFEKMKFYEEVLTKEY